MADPDFLIGRPVYVNGTDGDDNASGRAWSRAKATLQAAIDMVEAFGTVYVAPGDYDEAVVVPGSKDQFSVVGVGPRGSVSIAPAATDATALTVHGRDVELRNIGAQGNGAGHGARITGRRVAAYQCKFEDSDGTGNALLLGPGETADIDAGTQDKGDFGYFEDCEFAYADKGVVLQGSGYGSCGQHRFVRCESYNLPTAHFEEAHTAFGQITLHYRDLRILGHVFRTGSDDAGADVATTKFLSLNDDNANLGLVAGCFFPTTLTGGKNLLSTGLIFAGNYMTGGLSTGQPS